jgi:hypothetical protein
MDYFNTCTAHLEVTHALYRTLYFQLPTLLCSLFTSSPNKVRPLMSALFLASSTKTSFGQLDHGIGEFGDFFLFLLQGGQCVRHTIRSPHHISHVVHQYAMIYQSL